MLSMIKVKKELTKVNVENINTIKVEVQKVRYMIIPTSNNSEINPYLVIKYKYNNKRHKGYYFPIYYTFNSPKELKNKLLNLKRINIYKNTSVIECIDFYDNDYLF